MTNNLDTWKRSLGLFNKMFVIWRCCLRRIQLWTSDVRRWSAMFESYSNDKQIKNQNSNNQSIEQCPIVLPRVMDSKRTHEILAFEKLTIPFDMIASAELWDATYKIDICMKIYIDECIIITALFDDSNKYYYFFDRKFRINSSFFCEHYACIAVCVHDFIHCRR